MTQLLEQVFPPLAGPGWIVVVGPSEAPDGSLSGVAGRRRGGTAGVAATVPEAASGRGGRGAPPVGASAAEMGERQSGRPRL